LRVALAQLNPTVGDLPGNEARIAGALEDAKAAGAQLVEDAVVGQPELAVDPDDVPAGTDGRGVVDVVVALGEADDRRDADRTIGEPVDARPRAREEVLLEEQVLGRVAGDRELGEEDEVGAGGLRLVQAADDALAVPSQVADDRVDLRESEPHRRNSTSFRLCGENL